MHAAAEATDALLGLSAQRRAQGGGDGELETEESPRKERRTTKSSALPAPSSIVVEKGEPSPGGPDVAGEHVSFPSLLSTNY